jgi:hypothetical protein
MKIKFISLLVILYTLIGIKSPEKVFAQGVSVSFQVFYDELSPYGTWVENPDYGYVWVPAVGPGFSPYATNGYWVFTEAGWTWVSYYPWGWAPFHYGRWYIDAIYGPMWIPGSEWGPAWVTWRTSDNYYGWAPMGPNGYYNGPHEHWRFVKCGDFGRPDINNYYVNSSNNVTIINNTTVINNNAGPDRTDVEKHAGKIFTPVPIKEIDKPGQNISKDQIQLYKPHVQASTASGQKPAPAKVSSLKELKVPNQKASETPAQKTAKPNQNGETAPLHRQPPQHKPIEQPIRHSGEQAQPNGTPPRQEPVQPKPGEQPIKRQPVQPKQNAEPSRQQQQQPSQRQVEPQRNIQPPHQQSPQPQRAPGPPMQKNPH